MTTSERGQPTIHLFNANMKKNNKTTALEGRLQSYLGDITAYNGEHGMVIRGQHVTNYHDANNLVQVYNRLRSSNLTAFAKAVQRYFGNYWEPQTPGLHYYHNFISANKNARPYGLIANSQHNAGAAIVSDYIVTFGSLPSIEVDTFTLGSAHGITNILIGDLTVTAETTIGEFARTIVDCNGGRFQYGDILAFLCVRQGMDQGVPRIGVSTSSVILLDSDEYTFGDLNLLGFGTTNGCLSIRETAPLGGYTWVHARAIPNTTRLQVSAQRLTVTDTVLFDIFASPEKMREAAIAMGAKIPDEVSPAFLHHDPAIYRAFGVPCVSTAASGPQSSNPQSSNPQSSVPTLTSPFCQLDS